MAKEDGEGQEVQNSPLPEVRERNGREGEREGRQVVDQVRTPLLALKETNQTKM